MPNRDICWGKIKLFRIKDCKSFGIYNSNIRVTGVHKVKKKFWTWKSLGTKVSREM